MNDETTAAKPETDDATKRAVRNLAPRYRALVESGQASLEDAQRWERAASYGGGND